jgi:hypothetical protein
MNDPAVEQWIANSGLTKEECAMIQPQYGWTSYNYNHITPEYGISSSIISGVNISLNTINGIQIANGSSDFTVPIIGLLSGASQTILGAVNFPKEIETINGYETNESQKALSMINIGLGTATLILSTWNLCNKRKPESKPTVWNIYNFQTPDNKTGLAFSLTHKF